MNLGMWELLVIAIVALVFFGPTRLPSLGRSLGEAIRGFKKSLEGGSDDDEAPQKIRTERGGQKTEEDNDSMKSESERGTGPKT